MRNERLVQAFLNEVERSRNSDVFVFVLVLVLAKDVK